MNPPRLFFAALALVSAVLAASCVALWLRGDTSPMLLVLLLTNLALVGVNIALYLDPGDFG